MPVPFEANLTIAAAQRDMELHIEDFEAFALFSPGASHEGFSTRMQVQDMEQATWLQH